MQIKTFYKTENIIKVDSESTLSSVLKLLGSSHDAAFVFDGETFLGVINPYYCLIQKSYPPGTKVKNCLITPPRLTINDTVEYATQQMMESKIHYLPVFENDEFVAIISARRILSHIIDSPKLHITVGDYLKNAPSIVTINEDEYISKAISLFKEHKISKLVVVSSQKKLLGVLAFYDIISYLSVPRERQHYASRLGDKSPILQIPIKNFYKKNVLTIGLSRYLKDACKLILDKQIGSIVIVNKRNEPIGIITSKDIFSIFIRKPQTSLINIYTRHLSKTSKAVVDIFAKRIIGMFNKREDIKKAEVTITEKKQGGVFEGVMQVTQKGKKKVVREERKNLVELLNDLKQKGKNLISK